MNSSPAGVEVRPMKSADLPGVARLYDAFLEEQQQWDQIFAASRNPAFEPRALLSLALATGEEQVWVAVCQGQLAGFVRFSQTPRGAGRAPKNWRSRAVRFVRRALEKAPISPLPARAFRGGTISDLYVSPSFRREGVGAVLAGAALRWFEERGVGPVALQVLDANRAGRAFWERVGFSPYRHILTK